MKYSVVAIMEPGGQKNTYVYVVVPSTWYKDGKCWYPRSLKATPNLKDLLSNKILAFERRDTFSSFEQKIIPI